jgi:bla regulator protein blaR1
VTVMLRNLLVERFHLKVHHEERETQAYILTAGKNGPAMPAYPMELLDGATDGVLPKFKGYDKDGFLIAPPGAVTSIIMHNGGQARINSFREPIRMLCSALSNILKAPTVDQTGLTGRYDIRLWFAEMAVHWAIRTCLPIPPQPYSARCRRSWVSSSNRKSCGSIFWWRIPPIKCPQKTDM